VNISTHLSKRILNDMKLTIRELKEIAVNASKRINEAYNDRTETINLEMWVEKPVGNNEWDEQTFIALVYDYGDDFEIDHVLNKETRQKMSKDEYESLLKSWGHPAPDWEHLLAEYWDDFHEF
jgi:hypothetical protein